MSRSPGTMFVTTDGDAAQVVRTVFASDALLTPVAVYGSLADAAAALDGRAPGLVLVDIAPDPAGMLGELAELTAAHPGSRFVVVAPEFDRGQLFHSMQAGARHFMPKAWITPDAVPICRDLAEQCQPRDARRGALVTVIAAGGGNGATTVAINLADELARIVGERAALLDLDDRFGGVAAHLGVSHNYGIADLLHRGGALDAELVRSTSYKHGERLDVLLGPASVDFAEPAAIDSERLVAGVGEIAAAYPAAVVDAGTLAMETVAGLAEASTAALIVFQLNVKDLKAARMTAKTLRDRGVQATPLLVANRVRKGKSQVTVVEAQKALDAETLRTLPDDPEAALRALAGGEALSDAAPKSPLRRAILSLAAEVAPATVDDESATAAGGDAKTRRPDKTRRRFGKKADTGREAA